MGAGKLLKSGWYCVSWRFELSVHISDVVLRIASDVCTLTLRIYCDSSHAVSY